MVRFSFPILDRKDIINHLQKLGGPKLVEDNLLKPSPDILWPAYEALLDEDRSRDELQQPVFRAIDYLGHPELHHDSVGIIQTFEPLKELMDKAGTEDFSLWDILRPEPQRTIRFLSAGINLVIYRKGKQDYLAELQEGRDLEELVREESREELETVQSQLELFEADRLAQQPQVQALEAETKELEHRISALNKQQSSLQLDMRNSKQESNAYADKIANANFIIMEKQQERAQLQSQIVDNPDKLQRTLEEKKIALEAEGNSMQKTLKECEKWRGRDRVISKGERKLAKYDNMLQALEDQMNAQKAAEKEVKALKAKLKAMEKDEWDVEVKRKDLSADGMRWQELIEKLEQQKTLKYEEVSEELEALQLQNARFLEQFEARRQALTDTIEQTKGIRKTMVDLKADRDDKIAAICAAQTQLSEKFNEWNRSILAATSTSQRKI